MKIYNKKKLLIFAFFSLLVFVLLSVRIVCLMVCDGKHYEELSKMLHQRKRMIKAYRGRILDRTGVILADNKVVCTVSVIHGEITDIENVSNILSDELGLAYENVKKKVSKVSGIEIIKTNVDKSLGDRIREYNLSGVKVDDDYKRYYPYDDLLSKVLGFTGGDNQGVLGLEVKYDNVLKGKNGKILTYSNAFGAELKGMVKERVEPESGEDLTLCIDYNISVIAYELAKEAYENCNAKSASIIVMNPNNGQILTMVNYPEYNLNEPFALNFEVEDEKDKNALLNQMWRNSLINDTYEPGSTFKMITATIGLDSGVLSKNLSYTCCGYKIVENRRIRCAKTTGHGTQTFAESVMNSCNPAFIEWGQRIGKELFYDSMVRYGLMDKTGIDLNGEASTIMHQKKNINSVELATISFGQSFQITPVKMLQEAAMIVNGGRLVVPHLVLGVMEDNIPQIINEETSKTMREILFQVVEKGGGNKAYISEYEIGGKTATSEKLPRGNGKYIGSFIGFAPASAPEVMAMCIIDEPVGAYYGGTIAAPVIKELFEQILPYLKVEKRALD